MPVFEVYRINYMPSKKIVIPTLLVMFVGGWWYFSEFVHQKTKQLPPVLTNTTAERMIALDTDGDGLKDWEELLWKTDVHNSDSDGDGTGDNNEILANRNPAVTGPDDLLTTHIPDMISAIQNNKEDPQNLTSQVAENFALSYFSSKAASKGDSLPSETKEVVTDQVLAAVTRAITNPANEVPPHFSQDDFHTTPSSSTNNIRLYINALGATFQAAVFPEVGDFDAITAALAKTPDGGEPDLSNLAAYSEGYKKLAQDITNIPVPESLRDTHIGMANNFWNLGTRMDQIIHLNQDPLSGLVALNAYAKEAATAIKLLQLVLDEIQTRKFTFSKEEGGALFSKYIES